MLPPFKTVTWAVYPKRTPASMEAVDIPCRGAERDMHRAELLPFALIAASVSALTILRLFLPKLSHFHGQNVSHYM